MIWYKFHIGDYISHTMHLDDAEDLAYRRLLDWYYMAEKPLPLDVELVAKRIRLDLDVVEPVLKEFFEKTEEGYINARADKEIIAYNLRVEMNRKSAKMGGRPSAASTPAQTIEDSKKKPSRPPKQNRTEQIQNKESVRFVEFWQAWPRSPRKISKSSCEQKWQSDNLDKIADQIIAHVQGMKSNDQWIKGFEPAPMTYLNQRRYEDAEAAETPFRRGA